MRCMKEVEVNKWQSLIDQILMYVHKRCSYTYDYTNYVIEIRIKTEEVTSQAKVLSL